MTAKQLKETYLIKKMIKNVTNELNFNNPLKIRINHKANNRYSYIRHYNNTFNIVLNLKSQKIFSQWGYSNHYYNNRNERLNFVKNNHKINLRFTILHEIAHAILETQDKNSEYNADTFAIDYLTNKGLLKQNIKHIEDWSCD